MSPGCIIPNTLQCHIRRLFYTLLISDFNKK